jgi:hypothetical protein
MGYKAGEKASGARPQINAETAQLLCVAAQCSSIVRTLSVEAGKAGEV